MNYSNTLNWQPTATIETLIRRNQIIQKVRQFFTERCILEVQTPTLSNFAITDLHLSSFKTTFFATAQANSGTEMALITSPEYHMKRLIASGSGPIYQICHCFRNQEQIGVHHNPEFTMLEWYRVHFDMMQLINEVDDLLQAILDCESADKMSYQSIFQKYAQLDPLTCSLEELSDKIAELELGFDCADSDADTLQQIIFSLHIQPKLGLERPLVMYHFPASQAALAEISIEDHRVANRFEFFYQGIELANGFQELTDVEEQKERFELDNLKRKESNLPQETIDPYLLDALPMMPNCSGVALGLDRLILIALRLSSLKEVMSFNLENC